MAGRTFEENKSYWPGGSCCYYSTLVLPHFELPPLTSVLWETRIPAVLDAQVNCICNIHRFCSTTRLVPVLIVFRHAGGPSSSSCRYRCICVCTPTADPLHGVRGSHSLLIGPAGHGRWVMSPPPHFPNETTMKFRGGTKHVVQTIRTEKNGHKDGFRARSAGYCDYFLLMKMRCFLLLLRMSLQLQDKKIVIDDNLKEQRRLSFWNIERRKMLSLHWDDACLLKKT